MSTAPRWRAHPRTWTFEQLRSVAAGAAAVIVLLTAMLT